jgi:mono/diheme cytochrome c family protein
MKYMNKSKIFSIIGVFSISSMAFAAGTHNAGNEVGNNHSKMKINMEMPHWASPKSESERKNPIKLSSESILAGAELYQSNCAGCHGINAEGDGIVAENLNSKPANLRLMAGTHPDGDLAYKIKIGRGAMPGWASTLSNAEVWHLVNYIQLMDKELLANNRENIDHKHSASEGHDS